MPIPPARPRCWYHPGCGLCWPRPVVLLLVSAATTGHLSLYFELFVGGRDAGSGEPWPRCSSPTTRSGLASCRRRSADTLLFLFLFCVSHRCPDTLAARRAGRPDGTRQASTAIGCSTVNGGVDRLGREHSSVAYCTRSLCFWRTRSRLQPARATVSWGMRSGPSRRGLQLKHVIAG